MSRPGDDRPLEVAGDAYRLLAGGDDTAGMYMMLETTVSPGGGPPLHMHEREEEGFYVLEGEIAFECDGETHEAGPGTFIHLPKGSRHTFKNAGAKAARLLVVCAPAGIERFFAEAHGKGPEELTALAARYGITIFPPQ